MSFQEALNKLYSKYGKYGFSKDFLAEQLRSSIMEQGFSVNVSYNGLRMILAQETGEHELFSVDDVAEATGETPEWVISQIEKYRDELASEGKNPNDYFPALESEPQKVTWFLPHGLTS